MQGGFGLLRITLGAGRPNPRAPAFGLNFQVTLLVDQREK